ncbi:MAG TPA: AEC family transporter, partial [Rubrivivax sp.]|nr:AEC family transporter [Rubrivivax sp.]
MTIAIVYKLLAIVFTVVLGYVAGRMQWLGRLDPQAPDGGPARVLGNVAFFIFVPALLFRTTVRLDLPNMPWRTMLAFFVPVLVVMLGVYIWQRRVASQASTITGAATPSVRAISTTFGNSVQLGIPLAAALFGEAGLAIHVALVSLHALVLLSVLTAMVELDLARGPTQEAQGGAGRTAAPLWATLRTTARNTIIHPVVLPVLAGLVWNLSGLGLHGVVDESLATLAAAVVPVCLVLIGLTLAAYGLQGSLRSALVISAIKLQVLPGMVLLAARWIFGLEGVPLAVVVIMASLPVGSNALIFAQRYETLQAEATAAIVVSTAAFAATLSLWLALLAWLG